ncbi:MAG: cell division protein ZapA [Gammaproteobacteria bacterium]|nr:cell division protein ZapA [Gammaproteobacteria bacterium]
MSDVVSCPIKVFKKTYEMKCPKTEVENLQTAVTRLNALLKQHKQQFSDLTEFQLMLLSAVTMAHELGACQKQQSLEREQVAQVVGLLEKNKLLLQSVNDMPLSVQLGE